MKVFILLGLLLSGYIYSQDSTYYYGVNGRKLEDPDQAIILKEVARKMGSCYQIQVRGKSSNEWVPIRRELIKMQKNQNQTVRIREQTFFPAKFVRYIDPVDPGIFYFEERRRNTLIRTGYTSSLIPLSLEGEVKEYYPDGTLKSESVFHQNTLVQNKNYNPDGTEYIHDIFYSTDRPPLYSGGNIAFMNFFIARINQYEVPVTEVNDVIVIGAVVLETGELTGVRLVQGRLPDINEFFLETLELLPGEWMPAFLNGVPVRYFMEISFNLSKDIPLLQTLDFTKSGQMFWDY